MGQTQMYSKFKKKKSFILIFIKEFSFVNFLFNNVWK